MGKLLKIVLGLAIILLYTDAANGQNGYAKLKELELGQARHKVREILTNVNSYPLSSQPAHYDTLDFLISYFRIDSFRIDSYIKRGRYELFANRDPKTALQYFNNAKELAIIENDPKAELAALSQIAQLYSNTSINDKAIEVLMELKEKAEKLGDSLNLSSAYFQLAMASASPSDYSVDMFKKSLAYSPLSNINLGRIYGNIGHAYILKESKDLDSAKYFLETANEINDTMYLSPSIPLTLSEVYILRGEYSKADSLLDRVLKEANSYGAYDFSLLSYSLKMETLQYRGEHTRAMEYINKGIDKIHKTYFDDYDVVDFCRAAKKSLVELNDFNTYKLIDSIETSSKDSIEAYIEQASVSRSENSLEVSNLETKLSEKDDEIEYKNIALLVLGVALLLTCVSIYQTYKKRQLQSRLKEEGQKFSLVEENRKNLEEQKKRSEENVTMLESKMAQKIQQQERQLASHVLILNHKNNILENVLSELKELKELNGKAKLDNVERLIKDNLKDEDHWKNFLIHFENVHPQFYDKLKDLANDLTKQDKRILSYIKMQLTSKEIAQLCGVNYESVNTSRYRLRKKLNLPKDMELDNFIASL